MRRSLLLGILGGLLLILILSFHDSKISPTPIDAYRVGDVVYSLLNPTQFAQEHVGKWHLLNGEELENTDRLREYKIVRLPDARGVFLRSMNEGRSDDGLDPFARENNRDRNMGELQYDAFQTHRHEITVTYTNNGNDHPFYVDGDDGTYWGNPKPYSTGSPLAITTPIKISEFETRPKNISLFLYVKVSD